MSISSGRSRAARVASLAVVAMLVLASAACTSSSTNNSGSSSGKYGFTEATQTSGSAITVWVDSDRVAAANAFKKANPSVAIKVVTYDGSANGSNSFKTKIGLLDRAGSGWPDVVWST